MTDEYTPSMAQMREVHIRFGGRSAAEFDRCLTAYTVEAQAVALRETAAEIERLRSFISRAQDVLEPGYKVSESERLENAIAALDTALHPVTPETKEEL